MTNEQKLLHSLHLLDKNPGCLVAKDLVAANLEQCSGDAEVPKQLQWFVSEALRAIEAFQSAIRGVKGSTNVYWP